MSETTTTGHAWSAGTCANCGIKAPRHWAEPCIALAWDAGHASACDSYHCYDEGHRFDNPYRHALAPAQPVSEPSDGSAS